MPATRKRRPQGTQAVRKNIPKGSKHKKRVPAGRVPGGNGRPAGCPAPGGITSTHFLNPEIKDISPLDINGAGLFEAPENDHIEDYYQELGSPSEWVPALYKCLQRVPDFKDDKEWERLPNIHQLARHLLKLCKNLCPKDFRFAFTRRRHGSMYQLTFCKPIFQMEKAHTLCVEWLPVLETHYPKIGRLAIQMLSKVAEVWRLDRIETEYNDMIIYDSEAHLSGEPEYDAELKKTVELYKEKGQACEFRERMKKECEISNEDLFRRIKGIDFTTVLGIKLECWLEAGMAVLKNPGVIGQYLPPLFFTEDFNEIKPLNANDIFGIHWSFRDVVYGYAENLMNSTEREAGICGPVIAYEYTEKHTNNQFDEAKLKLLKTYIDLGRDIYFKHFDKGFEMVYADIEKSKTLLEILGI